MEGSAGAVEVVEEEEEGLGREEELEEVETAVGAVFLACEGVGRRDLLLLLLRVVVYGGVGKRGG